MWVWIRPGRMYPPRALTCLSCRPKYPDPIPSMRPSRIDTSPSTTSNWSFIVTMVPPRIRRLGLGKLRRRPLHRCRMFLAVVDGNELREIVGVAAREDDGIGVRRQIRARDPRGDVLDDDLDGCREAFRVGELLAIVHDVDAEPDFVSEPRQMEADVAGPDDIQLRGWF